MIQVAPLPFALLLLLSTGGACRPTSVASEPPAGPAITAPAAASARIESTATPDAGLVPLVSFARPSKDARWVRVIRPAPHFLHLTLDGDGAIRVGWIREAEHVAEGEGVARAQVRLGLERDGHAATVALGDLYGEMEPGTLSYCARAGYRSYDGSRLETPHLDGFVSAASVGNTTGDEEVLVVLAGSALHVLGHQTSDGMCVSETMQGPMMVCHGEEYARIAEIKLARPPGSFEESVAVTTETGPGSLTIHPLDCAASTTQMPLLSP